MHKIQQARSVSLSFRLLTYHEQNFYEKLEDYCLHEVAGVEMDQFTDEDRRCVDIVQNVIYSHKVLRINYITYNMWHDQDSINPQTRSDIMVL